jgi:hypothetical protein
VRIGRRVPMVLAGALAVTLVGGVAAAVTAHPSSAKACVTSAGALRLSIGGKCASGQTAIKLGSQGPAGAPGARGPKGATGAPGPQGDVGPAGTAQRINFSQVSPEATTVSHALATAGSVTLLASCNGTTVSPAATSLVLSVTGGTVPVTFSASVVSSDNVTTPATVAVVVDHGSTASLGSAALPAEAIAASVTPDTRSDVVTIVVNAGNGKEITGTLDVELSTVTDSPACTIGGTIAAA